MIVVRSCFQIEFCSILGARDGRLNDLTCQMLLRRLDLVFTSTDRPRSFQTAVLGNVFALGWSAQKPLSASEKSVILNAIVKRFSQTLLQMRYFCRLKTLRVSPSCRNVVAFNPFGKGSLVRIDSYDSLADLCLL